jgi:hypothetical protein
LFQAVSTTDGLTAFWTADAAVQPSVGSIASFGFPGAPARLKMRIETLDPDKEVAWLCEGDFPYWQGTRISWQMRPGSDANHTTLVFRQAGWPADYPDMEFAHVNFTWGQIVARLQAYAESGKAQPYFPAPVGAS